MIANVVHYKRHKDDKKNSLEPTTSTTKYTGKADIGGNWLLYNT